MSLDLYLKKFESRLAEEAEYTYPLLRLGLGTVAFLAGTSKIFQPMLWGSYMAPFFVNLFKTAGLTPKFFMLFVGISEIVFGGFVLADYRTTISSAVLTGSIISIIVNLVVAQAQGAFYTDIIIRDLGILLLALVTTLQAAKKEHETEK